MKFEVMDLTRDSHINPAANDGMTAMHCAAENGHYNVVNFYLENLEDKNPKIRLSSESRIINRTPLHEAASKGHLEIVKAIANDLSDKNP